MTNSTDKLYRTASILAVITIVYNIAEGLIATYMGVSDESLSLFGFGIDSFIETISGSGIFYMILRIRENPDSKRGDYERTALRITGFSFYALVMGLVATGCYHLYIGHTPADTLFGAIIAGISILVMWILIYQKTKVGKALQSDAILADAECAKVCMYMSVVLLLSSLLYEVFHLPYVDSAGAFVLAYFSFKEGKECFEKAASDKLCNCH